MVLNFLAVDDFNSTRKIVNFCFNQKLEKMLEFCQNWIYGQKFDFSNSVNFSDFLHFFCNFFVIYFQSFQLVIGVRESYVNLCSNPLDRLQIYRENFERAYIEATEQFYNVKAPQQLAFEADAAGVFGYMKWAEAKLREEEQRALKYLETSTGLPVSLPVNGPAATATSASAISSSVQVIFLSFPCFSLILT